MALILNGTNGLSDVDGSAATPAIRGSDANTGVFFDSDVVGLSTDGTERVRVDASGNVGIGTSSPTRTLDVMGAQSFQDSAGERQLLISNDSTLVRLFSRNRSDTSSVSMAFFTGVTERMRIAGTGLLVGATAGVSSSVPGVQIYQNGPNGGSINIANNITGTFDGVMSFINGNGTVGKINTSGSSTSYNTSSDYRLKHDIQPMTGALAKVAALKPVTYKWNVDDSADEGFIAHELAEVCPSAVHGEKDAVNEDGYIKPQGIDTSFLSATLTAALQELHQIVQAQAAEIAELKAKLP